MLYIPFIFASLSMDNYPVEISLKSLDNSMLHEIHTRVACYH